MAEKKSVCEKIDNFFFPYDLTPINSRGLYLQASGYNLYRIAMGLITILMQTLLMLYGPTVKNFTYLTYWGFTATSFYFVCAMFENMAQRVYGNQLKFRLWKFIHFIFPDILVMEFIINTVFWSVLFPPLVKQNSNLKWLDIVQGIGAHLFPLILLVVDLINNQICSWSFWRVGTTMVLMGCYLILNVAYTLEVTVIYAILTYQGWMSYVFIVGCIIAVLWWHFVYRLVSKYFKIPRIIELLGIPTLSQDPTKVQIMLTTGENFTTFNYSPYTPHTLHIPHTPHSPSTPSTTCTKTRLPILVNKQATNLAIRPWRRYYGQPLRVTM